MLHAWCSCPGPASACHRVSTAGLDVAFKLKVLQMQILASPHLPSSTAKDRPMEDHDDDDSDAEMADYGTDSSDDVDPNFVRVYCS